MGTVPKELIENALIEGGIGRVRAVVPMQQERQRQDKKAYCGGNRTSLKS